MTSRVLARFLRARIARHDARAKVFGAATVAALLKGDRQAAAGFQEQMHRAQALRDGLRARLDAWSVKSLPNGDFEITYP
jgi:hypothetical protein